MNDKPHSGTSARTSARHAADGTIMSESCNQSHVLFPGIIGIQNERFSREGGRQSLPPILLVRQSRKGNCWAMSGGLSLHTPQRIGSSTAHGGNGGRVEVHDSIFYTSLKASKKGGASSRGEVSSSREQVTLYRVLTNR